MNFQQSPSLIPQVGGIREKIRLFPADFFLTFEIDRSAPEDRWA